MIASDPRAASPTSWCGLNLLGQALVHTRDSLRQITPAVAQPGILAPRDEDTDDTFLEVDPITHVRLNRSPLTTATQSAKLSAFTDSVPDDHAPEVLVAYATSTSGAWSSGTESVNAESFADWVAVVRGDLLRRTCVIGSTSKNVSSVSSSLGARMPGWATAGVIWRSESRVCTRA